MSLYESMKNNAVFPKPARSGAVLELSSVPLGDKVYSVPCGECKDSWMFINLKHAPTWGPEKSVLGAELL